MITETKEYKDLLEKHLTAPFKNEHEKGCFHLGHTIGAEVAESLLDRDKYAMEFAEWCTKNKWQLNEKECFRNGSEGNTWIFESITHSELLELFKKR